MSWVLFFVVWLSFILGFAAACAMVAARDRNDLKDAERYRYMRKNLKFEDLNGPSLRWYLPRWDRRLPPRERLDRAIDANLK